MSAEVNPAGLGHVAQTRSEATPANALLEGQAILTIVKDVRQICLRVSFIYITEKLRQYGTSIVHLRMTQWDIFSSFFSVMHLQFYILA
jgi:hypothetical protein